MTGEKVSGKRIAFLAIFIGLTVPLMSYSAIETPTVAAPRPSEITPSIHEISSKERMFKRGYQVQEAPSASLSTVQGSGEGSWFMAGANPQRTSWVPEQVPSAAYLAAHRDDFNNGLLYPQWAKPIEPYITHKVQIIAVNDTLYIASSKGLYALYASDPDGNGPLHEGDTKWVYPTDLPLGNSPTVVDGVAYVGGFDHKLHAIEANPNQSTLSVDERTGQQINEQVFWTFQAEAGFQTNPVVANHMVYLGSRDGYFYAVYAQSHPDSAKRGKLAWKFKTGGPILFSAATDPTNSTLYFASNDSYTYALNALTGALLWQSAKLPGAGFHSWWPVVYQNVVVYVGSQNYRDDIGPGPHRNLENLDGDEVFPGTYVQGTPVGLRNPDGWLDTSRPNITSNGSTLSLSSYFENKPWRRTYFILDRNTGQEITADFNSNGKREYAPMLWFGSQSGNRYPPVVGSDSVLYQTNCWMAGGYINGGGISGWKIGTPYISTPSNYWHPCDEPIAISVGGNIIYWATHNDLAGGGVDVSVANTRFLENGNGDLDYTRDWIYWDYNLQDLMPGYDIAFGPDPYAFGGKNGVYTRNGDQPAPIPYHGKVYFIKANAVLAFGTTETTPVVLPLAEMVARSDRDINPDRDLLKQILAVQVQKIVDSGHLRPGYLNSGHIVSQLSQPCSDSLQDYWHNPVDTLYTLIRALPHLPPNLQQSTRDYLQSEFAAYLPYQYSHIGWKDGAAREIFDLPPEVEEDRANYPPSVWYGYGFEGWVNFPPHMFYALWKYVEVFGDSRSIFEASKDLLEAEPGDDVLREYPFVVNSFIAGYIGYLNLQQLAFGAQDPIIQTKLDRLFRFRVDNFSVDTPYTDVNYCRSLSVSRNFLFLTPELGQYLHDHALIKVQSALNVYYQVEPYWFVAGFEDTFGEAIIQPLYDLHALFLAKSLILKEPRPELVKYLDVPAFEKGDIFYILNLIAAIEAPAGYIDGNGLTYLPLILKTNE